MLQLCLCPTVQLGLRESCGCFHPWVGVLCSWAPHRGQVPQPLVAEQKSSTSPLAGGTETSFNLGYHQVLSLAQTSTNEPQEDAGGLSSLTKEGVEQMGCPGTRGLISGRHNSQLLQCQSHPGGRPWPMGCPVPLWVPDTFVQTQGTRGEAALSSFGAFFGDITDASPPPRTWHSPPWLPDTVCAPDYSN